MTLEANFASDPIESITISEFGDYTFLGFGGTQRRPPASQGTIGGQIIILESTAFGNTPTIVQHRRPRRRPERRRPAAPRSPAAISTTGRHAAAVVPAPTAGRSTTSSTSRAWASARPRSSSTTSCFRCERGRNLRLHPEEGEPLRGPEPGRPLLAMGLGLVGMAVRAADFASETSSSRSLLSRRTSTSDNSSHSGDPVPVAREIPPAPHLDPEFSCGPLSLELPGALIAA